MPQTEFSIRSSQPIQLLDLTDSVAALVKGVKEGICLVYLPHATAGIIVNEYEPNIEQDFLEFFSKLVPKSAEWKHNKIDDNAEAHLKSALAGPSATVPVADGKLVLGTWQRILLCEFDGPRRRRFQVQVVSATKDSSRNLGAKGVSKET